MIGATFSVIKITPRRGFIGKSMFTILAIPPAKGPAALMIKLVAIFPLFVSRQVTLPFFTSIMFLFYSKVLHPYQLLAGF